MVKNNSEWDAAFSLLRCAAISSYSTNKEFFCTVFLWGLGSPWQSPKRSYSSPLGSSLIHIEYAQNSLFLKTTFYLITSIHLFLSKSQKCHQFHVDYIFSIPYKVLFIIATLTMFFSFLS